MNLSETAELIATMAAYDQRTIGEADVIAWQTVLTDAPFQDCREAVLRYYAEHTDRIMPAHVRRIVRDIRREREAAARATGWAPGQAGVPKDQAAPEVHSGGRMALSDLPAAVADLVAQVRAGLPEGDPEALYPRRAAWEREHAAYLRTKNAEPNPLYRTREVPTCPVIGGPCPGNDHGVPCREACETTSTQFHAERPGGMVDGPMSACPGVITTWVDQVQRHRDGTVCGHGSIPARAVETMAAEPTSVPPWVQCPLCTASSQFLSKHLADYHPEAVGLYREDGTAIPAVQAVETMAPGLCGHPGHPAVSHLCMSGGVPFSVEHYRVDE